MVIIITWTLTEEPVLFEKKATGDATLIYRWLGYRDAHINEVHSLAKD